MSFCIEMLDRMFREQGMPLGLVIGATAGLLTSIWAVTGEPPIVSGTQEVSAGQGVTIIATTFAAAIVGGYLGSRAQFSRDQEHGRTL